MAQLVWRSTHVVSQLDTAADAHQYDSYVAAESPMFIPCVDCPWKALSQADSQYSGYRSDDRAKAPADLRNRGSRLRHHGRDFTVTRIE